MTEAVIVSTARTPIGKAYKGALNHTEGATLLGHAISSALSRALSGNNGTTLNFGSQAQGLASQEMANQVNRRPVLTRDQAMPMTVTVGQRLDFTSACKKAMQVDPMACPLL